jgi:aryl-alcohol dehydrogenase-like predicted oxidoreductase
MPHDRPLGRSGLLTPPLILGSNVFGWTVDARTAPGILDAFVHGGGRMIDTADVYSSWAPGNRGGESETIIGDWLSKRGRRDDVLIATKVGGAMGGSRGLAPERIARSADDSLRRLQTDHIDLYFAHFDDPSVPIDDVLGAFDELVEAGKVRAVGASNFTAERLTASLGVSGQRGLSRYEVLQPMYNLLERGQFEGALQQVCLEHLVAAVPYYGLASGFLTGKYRSQADLAGRPRSGSVGKYLTPRGSGVLAAMDHVAGETGASLAQIALAWLAAQPGVAAPIASATSVAQVEELVGAMHIELTPQHFQQLDGAPRTDATA